MYFIFLIITSIPQQPQSPKEQPKKGDQKGDDNKKQGGKHLHEPALLAQKNFGMIDQSVLERRAASVIYGGEVIRCVSSEAICLCLVPSQDSRRERSNNFQAFVKMALETLLGSCRRKHGGPRGRQG